MFPLIDNSELQVIPSFDRNLFELQEQFVKPKSDISQLSEQYPLL